MSPTLAELGIAVIDRTEIYGKTSDIVVSPQGARELNNRFVPKNGPLYFSKGNRVEVLSAIPHDGSTLENLTVRIDGKDKTADVGVYVYYDNWFMRNGHGRHRHTHRKSRI